VHAQCTQAPVEMQTFAHLSKEILLGSLARRNPAFRCSCQLRNLTPRHGLVNMWLGLTVDLIEVETDSRCSLGVVRNLVRFDRRSGPFELERLKLEYLRRDPSGWRWTFFTTNSPLAKLTAAGL
jgi:hypothetical protein